MMMMMMMCDEHLIHFTVFYSTARVVEKVEAHHDAVSCMKLRYGSLISGSWDASVKGACFTYECNERYRKLWKNNCV